METKSENGKAEAIVTVSNYLGLHARASAMVVVTASRFQSEIFASRVLRVHVGGEELAGPDGDAFVEDYTVDAKSIMGVMMLLGAQGMTIKLRAEGPDAREAIDELVRLFENRFGEER